MDSQKENSKIFQCENCGRKLRILKIHAGKRIVCPACKKTTTVLKIDKTAVALGTGQTASKADLIKFRCENCSKKLGVPKEYTGKKVKCPACGTVSKVPAQQKPVVNHTDVAECLDDSNPNKKTKSRIGLYVCLALLCIVTGALGIFVLTISHLKDNGNGDRIEASAFSHQKNDSSGDKNETSTMNSPWALFMTNKAFVGKFYMLSDKRGEQDLYGEELINWMCDLNTNFGTDGFFCKIKASFTIADVVSEIGPYKEISKNKNFFTLAGSYNEYQWEYFNLHTDTESDKVIRLYLKCKELRKILPLGAKLTEAAKQYRSRQQHIK